MDRSVALLQLTQRSTVDPNVPSRAAAGGPPPAQEPQPCTDCLCCDGRRAPFRAGTFDAAISIAVIHHYATVARRRAAVAELLRLVRPDGGQVLLYVWALDGDAPAGEAKATEDAKAPRPTKRKKTNQRLDPTTGDALVRWQVNQKFDATQQVFERFYHFFTRRELEDLCRDAAAELRQQEATRSAAQCRIKECYLDCENWCIVLERFVD
ncbi:hypothetical protein STCU_05573 [Strigomonas culicis]|nr:hypothetical protein STCU_05573 [Strigomonas culicis]|eukprot:EPY27765.1 hypothetical protein STCU_05573 [Strigomonas culicis]